MSNMVTKERIMQELETVMDPELGLDLVTLGLIYNIEIVNEKRAKITMTFTTPLCPFGPALKEDVTQAMYDLGFTAVEIEVTFDPVWTPPAHLREMLGV